MNDTGQLALLTSGITLGLGAAVPIGPVNVEMARRALTWGWRPAACLGLGAVTVDCIYATAASLGMQVAAGSVWINVPLGILGIAFLSWLGVQSLRQAFHQSRTDWADTTENTPRPPARRSYVTGLLMTFTNPMTLVFWFLSMPGTAGAILQNRVGSAGGGAALPIMAAGVTVGAGLWVLLWCTLLTGLGRFRRPWWVAASNAIGGVTLLILAGLSAVRLVQMLSA